MKWFERFKDIRLVVDYNDIYGDRGEFLNSYVLYNDVLYNNVWYYIYVSEDMFNWYDDNDLFLELSNLRVSGSYFKLEEF